MFNAGTYSNNGMHFDFVFALCSEKIFSTVLSLTLHQRYSFALYGKFSFAKNIKKKRFIGCTLYEQCKEDT